MSQEYENSDESPDRTNKSVPTWASEWVALVDAQKEVDPDSIFGGYMKQVNLLEVFPENEKIAREVAEATKHNRRNSLDVHAEPSRRWSKDKLRKEEVLNYKRVMGQTVRRDDLWRKPSSDR